MEVPQIEAVVAIALVAVTVASVKVIAYDIIVVALDVSASIKVFVVVVVWC